MKKELEEQLVKDFPNLFSDMYGNMAETCMAFGCECGDGWYEIIRGACAELEPLVIKWKEEHPVEPEFRPRFAQIKEKFGTLCLYMTSGSDEIYDITSKWEHLSATTCETCGKQGDEVRRRGRGWIYTACLEHTKPHDLDNLEFVEDADNKKKGLK